MLGHIVVSPFGIVKFKHFFLADVLTSAKLMFNDADAMVCFYTSRQLGSPTPVTCQWQGNLNYFWNIVPAWWRLMQCLKRYHEDRSNVNQLYNAGKYFTGVAAAVLAMMYKLENG